MEELCGRRDLDPEDEQLEQEVGRGKTEREMERERGRGRGREGEGGETDTEVDWRLQGPRATCRQKLSKADPPGADTFPFWKFLTRAGGMAQWVEWLLPKCEDPSSDPQ